MNGSKNHSGQVKKYETFHILHTKSKIVCLHTGVQQSVSISCLQWILVVVLSAWSWGLVYRKIHCLTTYLLRVQRGNTCHLVNGLVGWIVSNRWWVAQSNLHICAVHTCRLWWMGRTENNFN